jgi:hypothetical protein
LINAASFQVSDLPQLQCFASSARFVENVEMDTDPRPEWEARLVAELHRRGVKGSLKEITSDRH